MKIGIAGAGLLGRLITWRLLKNNFSDITLFDQSADDTGSAAYSAAGMLSPYAELDKAHHVIMQMGLNSIALWQQYLPKYMIEQKGSILIAHPHDKKECDRRMGVLKNKTLAPHYGDIRKLEPELSNKQGYYFSEEAQVNPREAMLFLKKQIEDKISWQRSNTVISTGPRSLRSHQPLAKTEDYVFDYVIDCRGTGGKQHFDDLYSVRGELIYVKAPDVNLTRPIRLAHPRYPIYIAPKGDYIYAIGATEIESDDNSPISVRSTLELLSAAYTVHKGFAEARIIETCVGIRPTLKNHLPKIIYEDGFIAVNGLYRHGFLLAPVLAERIVSTLRASASDDGVKYEYTH